MEIKNKIIEYSEKYQNDIVKFFRDLIKTRSYSGEEKDVINRIKLEMEKCGFDEIKIDGLGNILGRVGNGKRVLAFDGHIDTVEVGDPDLWEVDPFDGKHEDGIIYGRGASDQKAGIASLVYAGKIIKELNLADDYQFWVIGSVMEEDCDGLCWQYILNEKVLEPEIVVLTEPTNLNVYIGHRGRMELEVTTKGISCHGSAPERGVNAIYKMSPIIHDIEKLNERLRDDVFLGKGTVTISHIRSTSPSLCAVADSCTIHLDRRLTVGETEDVVLDEIKSLPSFKDAIVTVLDYDKKSYKGTSYPVKKYYPTWVMDREHPLVKSALSTSKDLFGGNPEVGKWTFSTNGIATKGLADVPTIGFGPANEVHAHSPTDQCPEEHLKQATAWYTLFPLHYIK